jgi:hypothetical protein
MNEAVKPRIVIKTTSCIFIDHFLLIGLIKPKNTVLTKLNLINSSSLAEIFNFSFYVTVSEKKNMSNF